MKYYAVTDDPRELYHYGVKGMKWGQHIFGDKPKSPGYKRAVSKLRGFAKKNNSTNSRSREERKYEKAVKKAQRRMSIIENLNAVDKDKKAYDQFNKDMNKAFKIQKAKAKQNNKYIKNEAKMEKYVQQARQGKLKYGKLSPDQIQRVQDRLQLEANTRRLGAAEKTWRQQKKEARRAGYLSGITKGTAAAMEEVARAGTRWGIEGIKNNVLINNAARQEGKAQKIKDKARNKKSRKEIERELDDELQKEAYRAKIRDVNSYKPGERNSRFGTLNGVAAQQLKQIKDREEQKRLEDNRRQLQDKVYEKLLLGGKGATAEQVRYNWEDRENIYKMVYGDNRSLFDNVKDPIKLSPANKSQKKNERSFDMHDAFTEEYINNLPSSRYSQVKNVINDKKDAVYKSVKRHVKNRTRKNVKLD